jgi:hypothetical protein
MFNKLKSMSKNNKILSILGLVLVGCLVIWGISYAWWRNSPNYAYYEFSQGIIKKDADLAIKYMDFDKLSKSEIGGEESAKDMKSSLKNNFDDFAKPISKKDLAENYAESINNKSFKKSGKKYELKTKVTDEGISVNVRFIFEKTSKGWKVTDIKYDLATLNESQKPQEKKVSEYEVKYGESKTLNGLEIQPVELVFGKTIPLPLPTDKLLYNTANNKSVAGKELVVVVTQIKNTGDKDDNFLITPNLKTEDGKLYIPTETYSDLAAGFYQKYNNGESYVSTLGIKPNTSVFVTVIFEVPEGFDKNTAKIIIEDKYSGYEEGKENYKATFDLA